VSVIAGAGRLAFGLALVARVVIAVWIVEVFDPPVLVLAVAVVGVTAALRQMVGNCLARRWRHWALAAVSAWVAVVVAVSVVVGVSGGRPFMAVAKARATYSGKRSGSSTRSTRLAMPLVEGPKKWV
jgi:thiol:disulfide interchange protein